MIENFDVIIDPRYGHLLSTAVVAGTSWFGISRIKTELKTEIHELRTEVKTDIHELKTDVANLKIDVASVVLKAQGFSFIPKS